jgi:anti-anti-sigma factor
MTELVQSENGVTLILAGEVNARTIPSIWVGKIFETLFQAGSEYLIIDLLAVERIDAYGLRFLLKMQKELAARDIQIILQNPAPSLRRLFTILKFDDTFTVRMVH